MVALGNIGLWIELDLYFLFSLSMLGSKLPTLRETASYFLRAADCTVCERQHELGSLRPCFRCVILNLKSGHGEQKLCPIYCALFFMNYFGKNLCTFLP